jgi:DMSO/TMAO reductase YedYZ heme-binding membrane subunit
VSVLTRRKHAAIPWRPAAIALARFLPLAPLAVMLRPVWADAPRLQVYAGDVLGLGATLCLVACLAVTPAAKLVRWKQAAWWRRWLGLCMFITGSAGAVIALAGPDGWLPSLSGHVQQWTGTALVAALIPLAVTSNTASQKMLGGFWKTWQQRLTWAAWAILAVHVLTLGMWRVEAAFFMASGPLIAARIPAVRKDLGRWRSSGYEDPARWVLSGIAVGVFACGAVVLLWMEVAAGVQAARLA